MITQISIATATLLCMAAAQSAHADSIVCSYTAARDRGAIGVTASQVSNAFEISGIAFDLDSGDLPEPQGDSHSSKVQFHDFHFTKKVDKASAKLLVMAASGTPLSSVNCSFYAEASAAGVVSGPYLTAVVTDAKIKKFKTQNAADGTPEMSVMLEYKQLDWKF